MREDKGVGIFSVLLVEDDPLIAMDLAQQVTDQGLAVVGPCHNAQDALDRIDQTEPDFAILDFNLKKGRTSQIVAKKLVSRNIPFCFLSGYSATEVLGLAGFEDVQCLSKPVDAGELIRILSQIQT